MLCWSGLVIYINTGLDVVQHFGDFFFVIFLSYFVVTKYFFSVKKTFFYKLVFLFYFIFCYFFYFYTCILYIISIWNKCIIISRFTTTKFSVSELPNYLLFDINIWTLLYLSIMDKLKFIRNRLIFKYTLSNHINIL